MEISNKKPNVRFFFNDEFNEKPYVNLSEYAWSVIREDGKNFDGEDYSFAGFVNRVFANFYEEADASVTLRLDEKKKELYDIFKPEKLKPRERDAMVENIEKLLLSYKKSFSEKVLRYEKGRGTRVRVNNSNVKILKDSCDGEFYDCTIGLYLKSIIEEYARKPMFEREIIYFKQYYDKVNLAIQEKKQLRISLYPRFSRTLGRMVTDEYYFTPYKIVQDKARMYNYIVGYAEKMIDGRPDDLEPAKECSYRFTHIDELSVARSRSGFLSKEKKDFLESRMKEKCVEYLAGDVEYIKVRFTDKGVKHLRRHIHMRPSNFEIVPGEENTYAFFCTEVQAMNYFFKFGREAEVLEPAKLRESFISRYRDAYELYVKDEIKGN